MLKNMKTLIFENFVYKYSIAASSSGGLYSTAKDLDTVLRSLKASFESMIFAICQEEVCIIQIVNTTRPLNERRRMGLN